MPNWSDSTGTRSSMPWNSDAKSRSGGSRSGENPKQRMPSRSKLLASVPPLIVNGTGRAPSSSALSAATIESTSGPSNVVSTALSCTSHSRWMPSPIRPASWRSNSSCWP